MYDISAKKDGNSISIPGISRDNNAEQILRGLLHEGYAVTIKERRDQKSDSVGIADCEPAPPQMMPESARF